MKKILIITLSAFILSSCSNKSDNNNIKTDKDSSIVVIENNTNIQQEDYDAIFTPNPNTLSVEQKETRHKISVLMKEHMKIKDGILYSTATKEDFESQDLSLYYYNMLNENLLNLNTAIKNDGLDAQKLYEEMMKDMMKEFPEI